MIPVNQHSLQVAALSIGQRPVFLTVNQRRSKA